MLKKILLIYCFDLFTKKDINALRGVYLTFAGIGKGLLNVKLGKLANVYCIVSFKPDVNPALDRYKLEESLSWLIDDRRAESFEDVVTMKGSLKIREVTSELNNTMGKCVLNYNQETISKSFKIVVKD